MAESPPFDAFLISPDHPLAGEHRDVQAWVEDVVAVLDERSYYLDLDLKSIPSGKKLVEANSAQARRYVIAAVMQTRHWDRMLERVRNQTAIEMEGINIHQLPEFDAAWRRRRQASQVVQALMRRSLPFDELDLVGILQWCNEIEDLSTFYAPIGAIARALRRFARESRIDEQLLEAMKEFAAKLRASCDKGVMPHATIVEQLCAEFKDPIRADSMSTPTRPAPQSAPAGIPGVLEPLKRLFGMSPSDSETSTTTIGPDEFPMPEGSPLRSEHKLLSALFEQVVGTHDYYQPELGKFPAGRQLLALSPPEMARAVLAAAERHVAARMTQSVDYTEHAVWQSQAAAAAVVGALRQMPIELSRLELFDCLLYLSARPSHKGLKLEESCLLIDDVERETDKSPLTEGERFVLFHFRASLITGPPIGAPSDEVTRLTRLIGDGANFCLVPGEVWSDVVNDSFARLESAQRQACVALFRHALTATASKPSTKWLKSSEKVLNGVGGDEVRRSLVQWLPLVANGRSIPRLGSYHGDARGAADVLNEENATCLRGLIWLAPLLPHNEELVRLIGSVALSAYKKVPGVGPRAVKVGNAAIYALSEIASMDAVGQLALLKVKVKFGTAQKLIDKALTTTAQRLGVPREDVEEMGVPSYGLTDVGLLAETLGEFTARLTIADGGGTELAWGKPDGKTQKSLPAAVKRDHADDLKELQAAAKDIQKMLPAQRDRIDGLFLEQKTWPFEVWRARYLDHPLVGTIARRIIWRFTTGKKSADGIFLNGQLVDSDDQPLAGLNEQTTVELWHPIGRPLDDVLAWRSWLEKHEVRQPFKQAHREVYLLTDAERNTGVYSNRYAAHILRQHQFNALCGARGWKNTLRLMVDDEFPPASRTLPKWNLRAEFWVEGAGDEYGTDTNDTGTFLYLATDQVRFYPIDATQRTAHAGGGGYHTWGEEGTDNPVTLSEIPALVFSEIMRDVDLFVGVASVGNDPNWADGGPQGRYVDYWQSYSFGDLSATAQTRKEVLERLVPRLKIAGRCSFSDKFLVVQGDLRTYKIHLGSGNILMSPNDEYLCIVPARGGSKAGSDNVFLPFEGDQTLSIILSKAFLLAEDAKIKDSTIVSQIRR